MCPEDVFNQWTLHDRICYLRISRVPLQSPRFSPRWSPLRWSPRWCLRWDQCPSCTQCSVLHSVGDRKTGRCTFYRYVYIYRRCKCIMHVHVRIPYVYVYVHRLEVSTNCFFSLILSVVQHFFLNLLRWLCLTRIFILSASQLTNESSATLQLY